MAGEKGKLHSVLVSREQPGRLSVKAGRSTQLGEKWRGAKLHTSEDSIREEVERDRCEVGLAACVSMKISSSTRCSPATAALFIRDELFEPSHRPEESS